MKRPGSTRVARPAGAMLPAGEGRARGPPVVGFGGGILAFYRWTAHSTGIPVRFHTPVSEDRYNQLTDSFDAGRLDLALPVPAGLGTLRDPYDPAQNAPYRATG